MLNQKQSDLGIGQPTKNIESEFLGLGIKPMMIFRVTKKPVPVRKAMIKHDRVTDFLFKNGYSVLESGSDAFGRPFWLMAKE